MATRNVTGAHVRQSMVASGGAVKARQLVSSSKPRFGLSCLLLYHKKYRTRVSQSFFVLKLLF